MVRTYGADLLDSGPIGDLVREGRLEEALTALFGEREREPSDGGIIKAIHLVRDRITQSALSQLEPLERVARLAHPDQLPSGIAERYVAEQLVDGTRTLEQILETSTLGRPRTARALAGLVAEGHIALERSLVAEVKREAAEAVRTVPDRPVVLVADANSTQATLTRTLARVVLGKHTQVVRAASGPEVVDATRREHPGLLLLDFALPGCDALEALRRLRQAGGPVPPAVVFVERLDADFVRGKLPRATGLLVRPIEKVTLGESIARAMGTR